MKKSRIHRLLKGVLRIQIGSALVRSWSLNAVYPRKMNMRLFDLINKTRRR